MKYIHFYRGVAAILLSSVLLFNFSACSQNEGVSVDLADSAVSSDEPAPSATENPLPTQSAESVTADTGDPAADRSEVSSEASQSSTSPLSTYLSVLQNTAEFFSTDANKYLNINQLSQAVSDDSSISVKATRLAIVDLDNSGTPEVILWLAVNENDYYGYEVLRYQDGVVFSYTLPYRALMDLKADGTFSYSGGASDYGIGAINFTEKAYAIEKISYCESSYDSDNNQIVTYYVDYKSATEEEFQSAMNKQGEKAEAEWVDFTDDNIKAIMPM
jgi:hypothetical protein